MVCRKSYMQHYVGTFYISRYGCCQQGKFLLWYLIWYMCTTFGNYLNVLYVTD
uniref:Uncharacterized protein n=1 Tax=Arundo donax TaxID=35708 RepID=A0A0A9G882_ARUDO